MTYSQSLLMLWATGFAFGGFGVLFAQEVIRVIRRTRAAERRLGR